MLSLHANHTGQGARFTTVSGAEVVAHYGDPLAEYAALRTAAGLIDLSCRGLLSLAGKDRQRFLHGQATNNIKDLVPGAGLYAAFVTPKGKMAGDANIYCFPESYWLDCEPGLSRSLRDRFEQYIIADDVQVSDLGSAYACLSVQGPQAGAVVGSLEWAASFPSQPLHWVAGKSAAGPIYCATHARGLTLGYDLFVPQTGIEKVFEQLRENLGAVGGRLCGWQALEWVRIEAGIPRFGMDMDEANLAPEAGIEARAISYTKGCYIGQEIISRLRSYGQVTKALRGLSLPDTLAALPQKGDTLLLDGKEAGYVTSAMYSPRLGRPIALGYVRREFFQPGTRLVLRNAAGEIPTVVVSLPFGETLAQPAQ